MARLPYPVVRVLVPLEVELEADAHENRYRFDREFEGDR